MFPVINTWMGGSFPALLSGFHSSCDQDGLEGLLFCFFILFLCSVILIDLNINIDLMFVFVIICREWIFLPIKWMVHENAGRDVLTVNGFLIIKKKEKDKKKLTWEWLSVHSCQKDHLATCTIWKRGSVGRWIKGNSGVPGKVTLGPEHLLLLVLLSRDRSSLGLMGTRICRRVSSGQVCENC